MADTSRQMLDEVEIRSVIAKFAIHGDDGQIEEYASVLAEDLHWEVRGLPDRATAFPPIIGRTAFLAFAKKARAGVAGPGSHSYHVVPTSVVKVDGDAATAKSYLLVFRHADTKPDPSFSIYNDRFVRTAEGWKLSVRYIDPA